MKKLTPQGQKAIQEIAERYNLSKPAVISMLEAIMNGSHTMAQFNIPELGGSGQWMQGGMIMVGDMFNNGLKTTVNNLCQDLSTLINQQTIFIEEDTSQKEQGGNTSNWWPSEWGTPSSSGSQNNMRYAYFSAIHRLALNNQGSITTYNTLDHQISGFSQQQGSNQSVQFTSQFGKVDIRELPLITGNIVQQTEVAAPTASVKTTALNPLLANDNSADIFNKIEQLAKLHEKGILSEVEFSEKKKELLDRL